MLPAVYKIGVRLFKVSPLPIILLVFFTTLFWAHFIPSLTFNYNIESFFSTEDAEVSLYEKHRRIFENENNFLLIGLKNQEGIFQYGFLSNVDSLSNALEKLRWIDRVISPTNMKEVIKTPLAPIHLPLVHLENPEKYQKDKKRIYQSGIYSRSFFSLDTTAVTILMRMEKGMKKAENDSLLLAVNQMLNSFAFDEFHLAGRIHTQQYYTKQMQNQMRLFACLASLLLIASLFIIFRNAYYVFIAALSLSISIIWILGIISWQDIQIDLMLTMLPALVFIISISSIVHIISHFKEELRLNRCREGAIKKALKHTIIPNFLNAFTTALGFSSLLFIPVYPIQQFGLLVALGIIMAFLINLLIIPVTLSVVPISSQMTNHTKGAQAGKVIAKCLNSPKSTYIGLTIVIAISLYMTSVIQINNYFLDDLNPDSSLKEDMNFFDENFSGIRPLEVNIQSRDGKSLLSLPALSQLDTLENYLNNTYKAGFILSPLSIIKTINKSIHGGNHEFYILPKSQEELDKILFLAAKRQIWNKIIPLINDEHNIIRMSGRTKDIGSQILRERNAKLDRFLTNHANLLQVSVTGSAHLMDNANEHIAGNLMEGILMAIMVATLIIGFFTGSVKLALLSLVPNLLPLLMISAFMGLTGIPLKVSTALIFTIIYGIAVDDTIHFLNSYRIHKQRYGNRQKAIIATIDAMWKPMTYTSVVLASGFMIFTLSKFPSISLLGYLVSASMIIALAADLVIFPVLLKLVTNSK